MNATTSTSTASDFTYEITYCRATAAAAEKILGCSARKFQKSQADGKGDRYAIRRHKGRIDDITCDYDASF